MRKSILLKWALIFAIALVVASMGFSRALRTNSARQYLIAHLDASFGRTVEVGRFDFSLLDGARLEAHSVTVAEDPHFGNEYFLRADTLTAGLRWPALLSGHFEFGSLSLLRPSLNLVRDAQGHWNMERWLPPASPGTSRPGFVGPSPAARGIPTARLRRIDVEGGRINFKQLDDKSPFALLDVTGRVEQDSAGRWALDLQARPMRAGVELQDIGTLRLRGSIAGTTARLQPADLNLTWRAVSVADALRLARGLDYGVRGNLDVDLSARIASEPIAGEHIASPAPAANHAAESSAAQWSISGVARLSGIHGWRLPGRAGDPAINLSLDAAWHLGEARAQIQKAFVEMPNSHLQGVGDLDWERGFHPQLHFETSSVSFSDVLAWYRAFRPGVAESLRATGTLGVDATLAGWPLHLQQGAIASVGGTLTAASLPAPLQIGALNASVSHGGLDFASTEISFSPASAPGVTETHSADPSSVNAFTLRGSIFPEGNGIFRWPPNWNLSVEGVTPRAEDWLALSEVIAQPVRSGWTAEGGVALKMRGASRAELPSSNSLGPIWLGTMDFRGLTVSPVYVNQPVRLSRSHVEYAPAQRTITLSAAEAFGATWRGTIVRTNSDGAWMFDLSADHLDAAELDRWLGPRDRPGLLERLTRLGIPPAAIPERDAAASRIAARGRLRVDEIAIAPLRLTQFDGQAELAGRAIAIRKAQANFFGGKVTGDFDAKLSGDPSYRFQGRFDRIDLAALGHSVSFLNNRVAGTATATLALSTHGIGRENLVASVEGDGTLNARNALLGGLNFPGVAPGENRDSSPSRFALVQGKFHIGGAAIDLADFSLEDARGKYRAEGRVTFSHALDVRIRSLISGSEPSPAAASPPSVFLRGAVEAPNLVLPDSIPKAAPKSSARGR